MSRFRIIATNPLHPDAEAMLRILQGEQPASLVNPTVWQAHLARLAARRDE